MMEKKHDIVETSKMSMEYDGSLIDVERSAKTDLDNGRLVVREGSTYAYPSADTGELFLVHTPEQMPESLPLTEFYNKQGKKIRASRVMLGDMFGTTAFVGDVAVGDVLMPKTGTGELVAKAETPAAEFTVVDKKSMGGFPMVVVERTK